MANFIIVLACTSKHTWHLAGSCEHNSMASWVREQVQRGGVSFLGAIGTAARREFYAVLWGEQSPWKSTSKRGFTSPCARVRRFCWVAGEFCFLLDLFGTADFVSVRVRPKTAPIALYRGFQEPPRQTISGDALVTLHQPCRVPTCAHRYHVHGSS